MTLIIDLLIFILCWSISLLVVLPIGVRTQQEEGSVISGTAPSAPAKSGIGLKFVISLGVAMILWGVVALLRRSSIEWHNLLPYPFGGLTPIG